MQGIINIRQSGVGTRRRLVDFRRALHVQSFVRTLVVEDLDKFVEAGLLLKEIRGRGFGGFFFQGEMHAFMTAVLLWMARLDAFNADSQA